ncbi:HWE histidine kinase domain-containing protein [Mesorhizobium sp.]|uniref:sensor histidine kinase n=1 Tax=Mesorhizobium sp. TaxID=1871066 RepID=UPI002610C861|nr:HWE histidine kinase domain-containing protein [Mesorhizobium sp.]
MPRRGDFRIGGEVLDRAMTVGKHKRMGSRDAGIAMQLNAELQKFALAYLPRARVPLARSTAMGLAAFAVALLLRLGLAPWIRGLAFLTFYPAILIASLFGGSWAGILVLGLGVAVGSSLWLEPITSPEWGVGTLVAVLAFLTFGCLMIAAVSLTHALLFALRDAEERASLVADEMRHRITNLFQLVQSIARLSAKSSDTTDEFMHNFTERLKALSEVQSGTAVNPRGISLHGLLEAMAATYGSDRLSYRGPDASPHPDTTLMLGLVLHELATNATKYGAWSASEGRVHVSWDIQDDVVRMRWQESGGPIVLGKARNGAGTRLLDSAFRSAGGSVSWLPQPEGLIVEIAFRLTDRG